jgi:hypothetical protein
MTRITVIPAQLTSFQSFLYIIFTSILSLSLLTAQEERDLVDAFIDHTDNAREVIYLHLNKSTYIKGESVGFTAYVLDKKDKMPSLLTTNLYVSIEDMDQIPIVQQLLKVENGVASNVFDIDDNFSTGSYLVKAYTNWSRNFKEPNYFSATIKIIDPATDAFVDNERVENAIDAQFLPESGHLLADVVNKVGVVLKDPKGYGLADASGKVLDRNGKVLTTFRVNHLGIGQFLLKPSVGDTFKVVVSYNYKDYEFSLDQSVQPIGLILSTSVRNEQLTLSVHTNQRGLQQFKDQNFLLGFHNGSDLQTIKLSFDKQTSIHTIFDLNQMPPGVTVFTLFNENSQPIAERLFFNYKGLTIHQLSDLSTTMVENDSIDISLAFKTIDPSKFHNISVSVLPADTKSYKHHHSLVSYNYLKPYINGPIEQAKYYFNEVTPQVKADLDMLLLTQGWSSYNWNQIFNNKQSLPFEFERGLSLKAHVNGNLRKQKTFVVHPLEDSQQPVYVQLNDQQNSFQLDHIFLEDKTSIALSEIDNKGKMEPAKVYLQFFPSTIPRLQIPQYPLDPKPQYNLNTSFEQNVMSTSTLDQTQQLDEVVITADPNDYKTRLRDLFRESKGIVALPNNNINPNSNLSGWVKGNFWWSRTVEVFINEERLTENSIDTYLSTIPIVALDYAEFLAGPSLGGGEIGYKLVLHLDWEKVKLSNYGSVVKTFEAPLTFSSAKQFYTPVYRYRGDTFYKNFGTIAWEPAIQLDTDGKTRLKIQKPIVPITLFIEGMDHLGQPIFYEHTLTIN